MFTVVGIDIETTSLAPEEGEIIEIAAVRYPLNEKFVRLCKPSQPISEEITVLTGITNEMVIDAPSFGEVLEELQEFIGEDIVFAHNASFDVKWLRYNGLSLDKNKVWDTFMLASVAWPEAESYNLGALVSSLPPTPSDSPSGRGRTSRGEHSALYDVEMAWRVLLAARERLVATPATYKRIVELLERTGLSHYVPLFSTTSSPPFSLPKEKGTTTNPPVFVPRPEQSRMAEEVEMTLREGGISLIEAPTGIGKTVAYLTPLLMKFRETDPTSPRLRGVLSFPDGNKSKSIISTHTKHLQDQIVNHDVPALQAALGTLCSVSVLKGRRNYVCTRRLGLALEKMVISQPDAWLLVKIMLWLNQGERAGLAQAGDLDRLNISHQGEIVFASINADSLVCRRFCKTADTSCPYERAWRAADAAQILIVSHALLAELAQTTRWVVDAVVVDEAHHIEAALRRATGVPLSLRHLQDIVSPLLSARPQDDQDSQVQRHLRSEATDLLKDYSALLSSIETFIVGQESVRLTPGVRRSSRWGTIEKIGEAWYGRCTFIIGLLESSAGTSIEAEDIAVRLRTFGEHVKRFVDGDPDRIQWVDRDKKNILHLHDVALFVAPVLQHLYARVPAVILTSATLTTLGNFSYIKNILGIEQGRAPLRSSFQTSPRLRPAGAGRELQLPSSFPLYTNMLIYLVDDAPDPRAPAFGSYIAAEMEKLVRQFGGRTLGLFTSYAGVTTVFNQLNRSLNKEHIRLYAQGHTGGRSNMLRRFRQEQRSVLLGTDSFWEGVDIPGDTLSCVVIPKLPFAPPHDPVNQAVSDALDVNSFETISLPQMILKLRQGVGRLIRRADDKGVVVIFDSRLHQARYGAAVINSLPAGRIKIGSASGVAKAVENWMGKDVLERWRMG